MRMGIPVTETGASVFCFLPRTMDSCAQVSLFLLSLQHGDANEDSGNLQTHKSPAGDSEVLHEAHLAHPTSLLPGAGHPGDCQGMA